ARDVAFEGMERPVWRGEGYVEEERVGLTGRRLNIGCRVFADSIGQVEVLAVCGNLFVVAYQHRRLEVACRPMDNAVVLFESALERPVVLRVRHWRDMPLAAGHGLVSASALHFGDGHTATIEIARVSRQRSRVDHVADARLVRIQSREQA